MPIESAPSAHSASSADADLESRFPRRLLFAGAAAGIAATAVVASAQPAEAAAATTPWALGGNSGVTTANFIGVTNAGVPLIFKTRSSSTTTVAEKMRLTPNGQLGIGVTVPAAKLDVSTSGTAVQGKSSNTTGAGRGVVGSAANGYGVQGTSTNNVGVFGEAGYAGTWGKGEAYGVVGEGGSYGAYFTGESSGVYAYGSQYGLQGYGGTVGVYGNGVTAVSGTCSTTSGVGVLGTGGQYAVRGVSGATAGVRGDSNYVGVWAEAPTFAVYANSTATTGQVYGVYGQSSSPAGYAVFAQGNAHVNGTLSKVAGSFRIDHPLDPDTKWLSHSFVESPDMMNVYNGNVTTDAGGKATVTLPGYFSALNRDYRYQLTVIGGGFAQAIVSKKIDGNTFAIATDKPAIEVSWQVTGIRQDSYAQEHPIVVETAKTGTDAGARQFVPQGSSAKLAPTAPTQPSATTLPTAPTKAPAPQNRATAPLPAAAQ